MYGDRIHTLRKQKHMTRAALGALLGVSTTAVYKWENNLSQPDIPTLQKLSDLFGVTIDSLVDHVMEPSDSSTAGNSEAMVARAVRRMTDEEREKYVALGKMLFAHAFSEDEDKQSE